MRRYSISLISLVAVYLSVHPKIANAELRLPDDLKQGKMANFLTFLMHLHCAEKVFSDSLHCV